MLGLMEGKYERKKRNDQSDRERERKQENRPHGHKTYEMEGVWNEEPSEAHADLQSENTYHQQGEHIVAKVHYHIDEKRNPYR
jgi:hypothetical protein